MIEWLANLGGNVCFDLNTVLNEIFQEPPSFKFDKEQIRNIHTTLLLLTTAIRGIFLSALNINSSQILLGVEFFVGFCIGLLTSLSTEYKRRGKNLISINT